MSTIAAPREPSVMSGRRIPLLSTPTSSTHPSLDIPRDGSPNPNNGVLPKRNRAALREYYNLQAQARQSDLPDNLSEASSIHDSSSDVLSSELDSPSFDANSYAKKVLEKESLKGLLEIYNGILGEIRGLDAEKKALVYDNYSKLIAATETIGRMREGSERGRGTEGVLGREVERVYERARGLREEIRRGMPEGQRLETETMERRKKAEVVRRVLDAPRRVEALVSEGRIEQARELWEKEKGVLERWRQRGVGGDEVGICIEEGDRALGGDVLEKES